MKICSALLTRIVKNPMSMTDELNMQRIRFNSSYFQEMLTTHEGTYTQTLVQFHLFTGILWPQENTVPFEPVITVVKG